MIPLQDTSLARYLDEGGRASFEGWLVTKLRAEDLGTGAESPSLVRSISTAIDLLSCPGSVMKP